LDRAGDQLHGIHNATLTELFSIGVEKERRGLLSQDGARDLAGWFTLRFGLSYRTAAKWAELATGLKGLPHLRDAFASGEVSLDKALAAVRFATPESDEMVATQIRHMNAAQVELTARRSKTPTETDEKESRSKRKVSWRWSDGGTMLNLHARLTAEQGAKITAALERAAAQMPRRDDEDDLSLGQRMADGLAALASVQIASDSDPDRANVLVHVDLETLRSGRGAAWTEDGAMFGSHTLGVILCDARLQALIEDENGKPLGLGRTSRATPVWMRRAVKARDKCCRFPGCGRIDFLTPHHIDEWIRDEGPTNPDNLVMLCPFHHALVHKADWWIEGEPAGDLVFIGPKGPVRDGPPPLDYDVKKWLWEDLYRPSTEALFDSS
ncbi:MAG: DUF222 domain-containing protein, partial [Actinomycetota bacterium]